jgi:hypothetical protein
MNGLCIEVSFIYGFSLGLEHMDVEEEGYSIIALSLGLIRICFVYE